MPQPADGSAVLKQECTLRVMPLGPPLLQQLHTPELQQCLEGASKGHYPLYVLFPGPGAADLADAVAASQAAAVPGGHAAVPVAASRALTAAAATDAAEAATAAESRGVAGSAAAVTGEAAAAATAAAGEEAYPEAPGGEPQEPAQGSSCRYALVAIDGTWQHAKEMFKVSREH